MRAISKYPKYKEIITYDTSGVIQSTNCSFGELVIDRINHKTIQYPYLIKLSPYTCVVGYAEQHPNQPIKVLRGTKSLLRIGCHGNGDDAAHK